MANLGELLAELRLDKRMTQKELANILHVTVGTISNYENGIHLPDVAKLINLADIFGVTTDYLLGRCESTFSPDVFSEQIVDDKTVGDFIRILRLLPPENRNALALIMADMEFHVTVRQYGKKENT